MTKQQKYSIRFLSILFCFICFVTVYNIMKPDTATEKAARQQKIHERKVRVTCIMGIKERLRYPDSMEIVSRSVINAGENKWIAEIGIRARNDFNAMKSKRFICIVHRLDRGYQLVDLE